MQVFRYYVATIKAYCSALTEPCVHITNNFECKEDAQAWIKEKEKCLINLGYREKTIDAYSHQVFVSTITESYIHYYEAKNIDNQGKEF